MKINDFLELYNNNIINKNTILKCKFSDRIFGDIIGTVTDYFIFNNVNISEDNLVKIECIRKDSNKKYIFSPENIIEVDGMNVERLMSLYVKRRKK